MSAAVHITGGVRAPGNHQQQRTAHGRSMGHRSVRRLNRAPSPAARDKAQDRPTLRGRAGFFDVHAHGSPKTRGFHVFSSLKLGRAFGLGHLSRGWACTPTDLADFRARLAAGLTPEQAGALTSQSIPHQPTCQGGISAEVHQSQPSRVHGSNDLDRDRKEFAGVRTAFFGGRNVFGG